MPYIGNLTYRSGMLSDKHLGLRTKWLTLYTESTISATETITVPGSYVGALDLARRDVSEGSLSKLLKKAALEHGHILSLLNQLAPS